MTKSNVEYGVLRGLILGALLFNIYMTDLFDEYEVNDIANYADDTTPYSRGTDAPTVISELQAISTKVFNWIGNNHMKVNPGKCHLLLSTKSPEFASIDGIQTTSSAAEALLGIINALGRIANYMSLENISV